MPTLSSSRALFAAAVACGVLGAAAAQGLAPDVHWGANAFPPIDPEVRVRLSLNRFTEFSKTRRVYNDIDETFGFNMLHVAAVDQIPAWPDWTYTIVAGGGPTADQPTRFLQNEFLHEIWGLDKVPVDGTADGWDWQLGGSLTWSRESGWNGQRLRFFAGSGVTTGSLYQELNGHVGAELLIPEWRVKLGAMERFSVLDEGDTLPQVADEANVIQLYAGYAPERIDSSAWFMEFLGNPEFGLTLTYDTGLFVESGGGSGIGTWFISLRVKWASGLMYEIWNDIANGTDFGPSVGMTFSVDLFSLLPRRWY
jgi:hypothetical protein